MLTQHEVNTLVGHLDRAFSSHAGTDASHNPNLDVLAAQVTRATELVATDAAEIALRGDLEDSVTNLAHTAQVITEAKWSDRINAFSSVADALDKALVDWTHALGEVRTQLDQQLDAHHLALQHMQQEGTTTIQEAAAHFHNISEEFQHGTVAPALAEAHAEAEQIAHEQLAVAQEILRSAMSRLSEDAESASAVLDHAAGAVLQGLEGLEAEAHAQLETAVQHIVEQISAAIVARVVSIVAEELATAVTSIVAGEGLGALVSATGPWLAVIHAAKTAMDLL